MIRWAFVVSMFIPLTGCGPAGSGPTGGTGGAGGGALACEASAAEGIAVAATDVHGGPPYALGYPPYAIDGCRLVYVAPEGTLRLRDLAKGGEQIVAEASELPRRPTLAGEVLAWEATEGGRSVVRVAVDGTVVTVAGAFDHAGEPRAAADAVVFTGWRAVEETSDTDVFLFLPGQSEAEPIAVGPGQQRFADISEGYVAYTDFSEDPDGRFDGDATDLADVVVFTRATGSTLRRFRDGKQAFPVLGAKGRIGFLEWESLHPEPKFSAYALVLGEVEGAGATDVIATTIETQVPYIRPAARGVLVEWVSWPSGSKAQLWRRLADLSAPAELVPLPEGTELYGPAVAEGITVLAARGVDGNMVLQAAAR